MYSEEVIWATIPGIPGYEASQCGRVRSMLRPGRRGARKQRDVPLILSPYTDKRTGYLKVNICGRQRTIHELVCAAFHGARPYGMVARHSDGSRQNNNASNLSWSTQPANILDRRIHGTHCCANQCKTAKLNWSAVDHIRTSELTNEELGKIYGVWRHTIALVRKRKTWNIEKNLCVPADL